MSSLKGLSKLPFTLLNGALMFCTLTLKFITVGETEVALTGGVLTLGLLIWYSFTGKCCVLPATNILFDFTFIE